MMRKKLLALIGSLLLSPALLPAQQATRKLDTTTFVVLGEGLAAGMANTGLNETFQRKSFPAQIAAQLKTAFPQPLIEGPGLGDVLGQPSLPVRVPTYPQGRVRLFPAQPNKNDEAPTLFILNLSVPNLRLAESLSRRPVSPLIHNDDMQQTTLNMILGFPSLILERDVPLWTQFEYAQAMAPTLALVELGYFDVLAAAVAGDPNLIPSPAAFRAQYTTVVKGLRDLQAEVVVTTIPDPMDTAYFSTPAAASRLFRVPDFFLQQFYGLGAQDFITRGGLSVIGNQFIRRQIESLPPDMILRAAVGAEISNRVRALNAQITAVASEQGAVVYDLQAFFSRLRAAGMRVGTRTITGDYFGGFYSLDGYYPGPTGHALIANEILGLLNRTYGENFPLVNLTPILQDDPVTRFQPARESEEALRELRAPDRGGAEETTP